MGSIKLQAAKEALKGALSKAEELKVNAAIAVVDGGAHLKAFIQMDEGMIGTIDVAIKKAQTARYFNNSTKVIATLTRPGGPFYSLEHSNGGLITFDGGLPLKNEAGKVVGAIGVSGGSPDQDEAIAQAGVDALRTVAAVSH